MNILEINIKGRVEIPHEGTTDPVTRETTPLYGTCMVANIECTTLTWNDAKDFRNVFYFELNCRRLFTIGISRCSDIGGVERAGNILLAVCGVTPILRRALALAQVCCIHLAIHSGQIYERSCNQPVEQRPESHGARTLVQHSKRRHLSRRQYPNCTVQPQPHEPNQLAVSDSILITPQVS